MQFVEDTLQECAIAFAFALLVDLVNAPGSPGVHGRIHVAECPLVSGNLSVGMHVPLAQHQRELLFREVRIHQRERNAVERQVPCRIPRILPLVGHGNHVGVVQVRPLMVAALATLRGRGRIARIAFEPIFDDVVIELLGPQHAGKTLSHDVLCIWREVLRNHCGVELVSFVLAEREGFVEAGKGVFALEIRIGKAEADDGGLAGADRELVVSGGLGAGVFGIYRILGAVHDVIVDAILDIRSAVLDSKQPPGVGFVLGEQQLWRAFAMQPAIAGLIVVEFDHRIGRRPRLVQARAAGLSSPRTTCCETTLSATGECWRASGPRFATVILIRMSSVSAFAYSTNTSK